MLWCHQLCEAVLSAAATTIRVAMEKVKSRKNLSNFSLFYKVILLERSCSLYGKHARKEPFRYWQRPCSFSSPLNSSSGCTENGKVPCRQRHPEEAAKDLFLKALVARVHAPASSQQSVGLCHTERNQTREIACIHPTHSKLYYINSRHRF